METKDLTFIQDQIGYQFKNTDLLQQAFVRRSYSYENNGENNEVLEFFGDKVLDFVVVKILSEQFGFFTDSENDILFEFACDYNEGRLSEIKKSLVRKETLAKRIRTLKLESYLIMGKSDIQKKIEHNESVQADLFEAILGAIAIDSDWNIPALQDAVKIMLNPDTLINSEEVNYVELIRDWTLQDNGRMPSFHYENKSYTSMLFDGSHSYFIFPKEYNNLLNSSRLMSMRQCCILKLNDNIKPFCAFCAFGYTKSEAQKNVCKCAYEYLEEHDLLFTIRDEIDEPCKDLAINQLEILARRGYFSLPKYDFFQEYDNDGNPIWTSICKIDGEKKQFKSKASSKKEAKKKSAFKMLEYVLNHY